MTPEAAQLISQTNFTPLDWGIVAAYLLCSVAVGLVARKLIVSMADYVSAGRAVGTALGVATMTGTELGLITVMYSAQKGFSGGFAAFHIALAAFITTFLVGASGFIVYRLRAMEVLTIPEYYERRFGRRTRILGGIMLAFGGILNMGLFLIQSAAGDRDCYYETGLGEHFCHDPRRNGGEGVQPPGFGRSVRDRLCDLDVLPRPGCLRSLAHGHCSRTFRR